MPLEKATDISGVRGRGHQEVVHEEVHVGRRSR